MRNKYQEALEWYAEHASFNQLNIGEAQWADETLQELVDKETPLRPDRQYEIDWGMGNAGECSDCKNLVNYQNSYCDKCGQKLDWSNDNETK